MCFFERLHKSCDRTVTSPHDEHFYPSVWVLQTVDGFLHKPGSLSQLSEGEGGVAPWTSHRVIAGPNEGTDNPPHSHLRAGWSCQSASSVGFWTVGGSWSTWKDAMQTHQDLNLQPPCSEVPRLSHLRHGRPLNNNNKTTTTMSGNCFVLLKRTSLKSSLYPPLQQAATVDNNTRCSWQVRINTTNQFANFLFYFFFFFFWVWYWDSKPKWPMSANFNWDDS